MGLHVGEESKFAALFAQFDEDGSGEIDEAEFDGLYHFIQARAMFGRFDKNRSGGLDKVQARKLLRRLGRDLHEHEMDTLFARFDEDASGEIDVEEFMVLYSAATQTGRYAQDPLQMARAHWWDVSAQLVRNKLRKTAVVRCM